MVFNATLAVSGSAIRGHVWTQAVDCLIVGFRVHAPQLRMEHSASPLRNGSASPVCVLTHPCWSSIVCLSLWSTHVIV